MSGPAPWQAVWARHTGSVLFRVLYDSRAYGRENVPRRGPVILAANHLGFLDGALVLGMAPRPSHFLVWDGSFDRAVGPLLRLSGQIPLAEAHGDRTGLGQALEVLKRNGVVGIFPEGARGKADLATANKGVAWLALQSRAAVVPTAVLGTRATGRLADSVPRPRSRLVVDFARPIIPTPPMGVPGKKRLEVAAEQIRTALATHVSAASAEHDIPLPTDIPPDLWS